MFLAHIVRAKDGNEGRDARRFLHVWPSFGFFPLHQAHNAYYFKSELARSFDGLDSRSSRRADIVHDNNARAFLPKALDTLPCAVLFAALANQKSTYFTAHHRDCDDDRVGSHCKTAHRLRPPPARSDLFQEYFSRESRSQGIEG